jgi:hypothetical protein
MDMASVPGPCKPPTGALPHLPMLFGETAKAAGFSQLLSV